jgi:transposase InsO family protein
MRDLEPAVPLIRYEHAAPGDLLHLDIKQLGRFSGVVARPDGRRRGKHHCGWEYVHVAIDDHSRIAFTQILLNFTAACAIAFLRTAVAYYAALGISIRRLLTDNGHCYRSHAFHAAVVELGLRHHFTRPYTPRTNGKAERFIQTALREWAYACLCQTPSSVTTNFFPGFTTTTRTALMVASKLWLCVNETPAIGVEASELFLDFEKRACVVPLWACVGV